MVIVIGFKGVEDCERSRPSIHPAGPAPTMAMLGGGMMFS